MVHCQRAACPAAGRSVFAYSSATQTIVVMAVRWAGRVRRSHHRSLGSSQCVLRPAALRPAVPFICRYTFGPTPCPVREEE